MTHSSPISQQVFGDLISPLYQQTSLYPLLCFAALWAKGDGEERRIGGGRSPPLLFFAALGSGRLGQGLGFRGEQREMERRAGGVGFIGSSRKVTPNKTTPLPLFPFSLFFYFFIYYNRSQFSKISHKFGQNFWPSMCRSQFSVTKNLKFVKKNSVTIFKIRSQIRSQILTDI